MSVSTMCRQMAYGMLNFRLLLKFSVEVSMNDYVCGRRDFVANFCVGQILPSRTRGLGSGRFKFIVIDSSLPTSIRDFSFFLMLEL